MNEAQLGRIRTNVARRLSSSCRIWRRVDTPDGAGGVTTSYTVRADGVSCYLYPEQGGGEEERGGRVAGVSNWVLLLPAGTAVELTDRIAVEGITIEVLAVDAPRTLEPFRRVWAVEVN